MKSKLYLSNFARKVAPGCACPLAPTYGINMKSVQLAMAIIFLTIGGAIYLGFRTETLLMFRWVNKIGADDVIEIYRNFCSNNIRNLPVFVIYSAPNGLWSASFSLFMLYIWGAERFCNALFWSLAMLVASISSEILQYYHYISGQFDIFDVVSYVMGFMFIFLFNFKGEETK